MKVAIAADHAGFAIKKDLAAAIEESGHEIIDCGTHDQQPSDYPDFARTLGHAVASGETERGVFVCGSGVGASVAANKIRGIRAGLCHDCYSARQAVEHDNCNVLCIGSRVVGSALAAELVRVFLEAKFSDEPRHARRLQKIAELEEKQA